MTKYIKQNQVVDINHLTDIDIDAIRLLMPDFYTQILNCGYNYGELYILRDGVNIKIISQDVLDNEYTKL